MNKKELRKRGISLLTAAFTVVSLSGCANSKIPDDYPEEYYYIGQESNHFVDFHKKVIRNGEPVTVYKGENIVFAFDKETFEPKEYIYYATSTSGTIYDLATGYMISDVTIFTMRPERKAQNWQKLIDENYTIELVNISDYIEGYEVKEWYTIDEIKELEPRIIESLKIINEYDSKVKVK